MTNDDQQEFWSTSAGPAWVGLHAQLDALFQPVLDLVLDSAQLTPEQRVLDIGCGTGASVLEVAARLDDGGHVTGVDIADTMLDLAAERLAGTANAHLLKADAQDHPFVPNVYHAMVSRFGVMFFDDSRAAFRNIATALLPGATLTFAAWGPAPDNPFFMEPAAAATEVLGPMPKVDRTQPGPFAFENAEYVTQMLGAAGLDDVSASRVALTLTPQGGLSDVAELCCRIGPADSSLKYHDGSDDARAAIADAITTRFAVYDGPTGVRIPASINLFQARKPA